MATTVLGIIGGSGVYDIDGLENAHWERVTSPWGEPSDELLFGRLEGVKMIFLPRHGRGQVHSPTSIDYLAMEGPQFSTLAESNLYRFWGCSVIGMTAMPEAKLAREAELPYALVAMVTDYDCWHEEHDHVTVDQVIKILSANAENARRLVKRVAPKL